MRRDEVAAMIQAARADLDRYGVKSLRLFGSAARNEALPGSDVDLLVEFSSRPTFATYMNLRFFLEDLLGVEVDLVTESGLRSSVRPRVEREAIRVA